MPPEHITIHSTSYRVSQKKVTFRRLLKPKNPNQNWVLRGQIFSWIWLGRGLVLLKCLVLKNKFPDTGSSMSGWGGCRLIVTMRVHRGSSRKSLIWGETMYIIVLCCTICCRNWWVFFLFVLINSDILFVIFQWLRVNKKCLANVSSVWEKHTLYVGS